MQSSWVGLIRKEVIQKSLWVNNMFPAISPIAWTAFIAFVLLALAVAVIASVLIVAMIASLIADQASTPDLCLAD